MDEISTKQRERLIGMTDELLIRRKEILRLIILVIIAALAMGFITEIASSWLDGNTLTQIQKYIFGISAILLIICIIWALRSYAGDIVKKIHFEVIIPFHKNEKPKVFNNQFYKPLMPLKNSIPAFIDELFKHENEHNQLILKAWKTLIVGGKREINDKTQEGLELLKFLNDLTEFYIFTTLAHFTADSTTQKACYMPMGWTRPNYKTKTLKTKKGLKSLQSNYIYKNYDKKLPQQIRFLKGFRFRRHELPSIVNESQKKTNAQYFEFKKNFHGNLRFSISPYPILMPDESRDVKLLARYNGILPEDQIVIKIPFLLNINFRGILMIRKKFISNFAIWIEDLVDTINDNLDWQHCAQHDLERMVVELLGREV
ncbi:MAG: hypothetical protein GF353_13855 [Candidatus Lokiarchaeota archaeon]|nr:hypothetical protein [Candidatus Lokiarchaeota archaeon]